ncbi:MAG TPA: phosphatidylglycerol lysyltransferase domain-containing protein, partial [Victivallales bacterium]|nr:phosphatidylglycerol lysyltransferase domain-containing protein [Victivallales bacterium]
NIPDLFSIPRKNLHINHVNEEYFHSNKDISSYFEVIEDEDFVDYVHLIDRLVELKGSKLAKKKNLISQFVRNHPDYKCLPITDNFKTSILELSDKWYAKQHTNHIGLKHEKLALNSAIEHFESLSLEGLVILAENKICAFSIFSRQNDETYIEHFEKADSEIKGSAQIINMETAKYLRTKAKFLNREQDLGIPGLRKAKLSYSLDIRIGGKTLKYI